MRASQHDLGGQHGQRDIGDGAQREELRLTGPEGEETARIGGQLVAHDMAFAVDAVAAGLGVAMVPDAYCGWAMRGGLRTEWKQMVRLLPDYFIPGADLSVVSPPVAYEPARVGLFRDFLVERISPVLQRCAASVERERAQRKAKRTPSI